MQGLHRLEKYLYEYRGSLKIKSALKSTGEIYSNFFGLENSLNLTIFFRTNVYGDLNQYKIVVPLFSTLHQIKWISIVYLFTITQSFSSLSQSSISCGRLEVEHFSTVSLSEPIYLRRLCLWNK